MTKAPPQRVLIGLVLLGFLAGLVGLRHRVLVETGLRQSEILLDGQALLDWQASLQEGAEGLPDRLLSSGVGSLAFGELHLEDLIQSGDATPLNYQEFDLALKGGGLINPSGTAYRDALLFNIRKWGSRKPGCYLLFADPQMASSIAQTLEITIGDEVESQLGGRVLFVPMAVRQLRLRSLGFNNASIEPWSKKGFKVWLRPENTAGLTPDQINKLFALWSKIPEVQGVIFGGALNEAIGYPDNLETTSAALKARGWKLGYIELPERAQQLGIESLVRALPDQTTRVLAVSPAHQEKLSPFRVLGMYSLGARERNMRVLYVRPFAVPGRPELDEEFLFQLGAEVAPAGPADTFKTPSPAPDPVSLALMSLAAGALAILLIQAIGFPVPGLLALALLALPVLGGIGAGLVGRSVLFRALLALAVGMGGTSLAFLTWVYPSLEETASAPKRGAFAEGLRLLFLTSLASVATGLLVAALIPDTTFLLGLDRFRGVKLLTLLTPLFIVATFLWKRYTPQQWWAGLMGSVKIYQAALGGLLLAAFGMLLLRTGNEGGAVATDGELQLRVVLDQMLGVRPRFKEFLLAHPALVCTPLVVRSIGFLPGLLMVLVAAIGQAGIVDTFAHVHTPLLVTLTRVGLGVGFGILFSALFYAVLKWLLGKLTKSFPLSVEDRTEQAK